MKHNAGIMTKHKTKCFHNWRNAPGRPTNTWPGNFVLGQSDQVVCSKCGRIRKAKARK